MHEARHLLVLMSDKQRANLMEAEVLALRQGIEQVKPATQHIQCLQIDDMEHRAEIDRLQCVVKEHLEALEGAR